MQNEQKTHAEHVAEIAAKNPNVEVLGEIKNVSTKVLTRCKICGYEWEVRPYNLKIGTGCPECGKKKQGWKGCRKTHDEYVADIAKASPNVEILGEITYAKTKVLCRCKICSHEWMTTPDRLKHGCGCPECKKVKISKAKRLTHTEQMGVIAEANPGVEVLEEIKGNDTKVKCRCKVCGHEWGASPETLKRKQGCPKCARKRIIKAHAKNHDYHLKRIEAANKNIEVLEKITKDNTKVLCKCKVCHHEWEATPNNLKHGYGCPRCAKYGFYSHNTGKLYIMVDDLEAPTMIKIGVSINEKDRSKQVLKSAHKAGVTIPALYVAKTWEGQTDLMQRIEQMMHENYEEWNIKFPAKFNGCTEFFYYTHETAEAFDVIEETIHEIINGNKAA